MHLVCMYYKFSMYIFYNYQHIQAANWYIGWSLGLYCNVLKNVPGLWLKGISPTYLQLNHNLEVNLSCEWPYQIQFPHMIEYVSFIKMKICGTLLLSKLNLISSSATLGKWFAFGYQFLTCITMVKWYPQTHLYPAPVKWSLLHRWVDGSYRYYLCWN